MFRLILVLLGLCVLTGCDNENISDHRRSQQAATSNVDESGPNSNDSADSTAILPKYASGADRALMQMWLDQNELCQGSSDAETIYSMCPKRDRTQVKLERRGWCWAYADWTVVRADYRWHRCTEKTLADSERSVPRSEFDNPSGADGVQPEAHYSDIWSEMKNNPSSPELAAYVNAAEPLDQKIGNAGAVLKCGIRSVAWYGAITERLEAFRAGPNVAPKFSRLTDAEKAQARLFDKAVADGQMKFSGGDFDRKSCEALAKAPFVYSDAAFAPSPF